MQISALRLLCSLWLPRDCWGGLAPWAGGTELPAVSAEAGCRAPKPRCAPGCPGPHDLTHVTSLSVKWVKGQASPRRCTEEPLPGIPPPTDTWFWGLCTSGTTATGAPPPTHGSRLVISRLCSHQEVNQKAQGTNVLRSPRVGQGACAGPFPPLPSPCLLQSTDVAPGHTGKRQTPSQWPVH